MLLPILVLICFSCSSKRFLFFKKNINTSLVGSVFPDNRAVYFRYWRAMFECDGPSLMLFCLFGIFLALVGHVTPHIGAALSAFLSNPFVLCFLNTCILENH